MGTLQALRLQWLLTSTILLSMTLHNIDSAMPPSHIETKMCKKIGGVPAPLMICPTGEGIKTVNRYHCCVKCEERCVGTTHAKVLNGEASTGCFGECMKCSNLTEPYKHYKNVETGRCEQCMDCRRLGKVEVRECTDIHNTQCADRDQINTQTSYNGYTTATVVSTSNIYTDHNSTVPVGTVTEALITAYKLAIIVIILPIILLLVIAIILIRQRSKFRKRKENQYEMEELSQRAVGTNIYSEEPHVYSSLIQPITKPEDTITSVQSSSVHRGTNEPGSRTVLNETETETTQTEYWKRNRGKTPALQQQ